ncbi:MAG: tRNA-intron lyase [Candidatus Altiarchaeota archaeon]
MKKISSGVLIGTKILVVEPTLKSFLKEKGFGEENGSRIELSLIEALFLIDTNVMEVVKDGKKISFEELAQIGGRIEKDFYEKYLVFKDLRSRGLIVRTGFKFGADFRVYERGKTIKDSHSKILVHVVPEEYKCSFPELSRAVRVANTVNKRMVFAIVDEEGSITYYAIDRISI